MTLTTLWNQLVSSFNTNARINEIHASLHFDSTAKKVSICMDGAGYDGLFIKIYDSSMNFLGQIQAQEGVTSLPDLPQGRFYYKLVTLKGYLIKKGRFNVTELV